MREIQHLDIAKSLGIDMKRSYACCAFLCSCVLLAGCMQNQPYSKYSYPQQSSNYSSQQNNMAAKKEERQRLRARNIQLMTEMLNVGKKYQLPSNWKYTVENAIKRNLKDPGSAKFEFVEQPRYGAFSNSEERNYAQINATPKTPIIGYIGGCYVNSKNSFGGYTGNSYWWWMLTKEGVIYAYAYNPGVKMSIEGIIKQHDSADCIVIK